MILCLKPQSGRSSFLRPTPRHIRADAFCRVFRIPHVICVWNWICPARRRGPSGVRPLPASPDAGEHRNRRGEHTPPHGAGPRAEARANASARATRRAARDARGDATRDRVASIDSRVRRTALFIVRIYTCRATQNCKNHAQNRRSKWQNAKKRRARAAPAAARGDRREPRRATRVTRRERIIS